MGLVSIIFGRMLPGVDAAPLSLAVGVGLVILANGAISESLVRRSPDLGYRSTLRQFAGTLAVNLGIVVVGQFLLDVLRGPTLEHALVFVVLLTFIITLYDRYRPMTLARFGPVRRGGPPVGT